VIGDQIDFFDDKLIKHLFHRTFISRDSTTGHQDRISFFQFDDIVFISGHPRQCSEFFALRSCREDKNPIFRHIIYFIIQFADILFRNIDIAQLLTDFDKIYHRSSRKKDYFIISDRAIDDLDYSSYVGSESCDEYSAIYALDDIIECFTDDFF